MNSQLKYLGYTIAFQEVPDEVSLVLNITNCPHRCKGCHSPELQQDIGRSVLADLPVLLNQYKDMITCVCFMGEGNSEKELIDALKLVIAFNNELATCVYTGRDEKWQDFYKYVDYIKCGAYNAELGGLDCVTTNQKFYKIWKYGSETFTKEDITYKFQRRANNVR